MIQLHGGNISRIENILDFSANINPLGMPESVRAAVAECAGDIEKYPDPYCNDLRDKLAENENFPAENIVCGNGADDLIFRIAHAYKPQKALVCTPSFSEYRRALTETGCEVAEHRLYEEKDFELSADILDSLDRTVDICFLCTPNNPTGRLIAPEILQAVSGKCAQNGTLLVCDECFLGFAESSEKYSLREHLSGNAVILKAFTKLYDMPGIRLGYALCSSNSIAERIESSGQFWSVSAPAQKAGIAALGDSAYLSQTVRYIAGQRRFLADELKNMGIRVFDAAANFLLFKSNAGLCEKMLEQGILIRDCQDFSGLTASFYRIAVRTREENLRFLAALRRCMNG